MHSVNKLKFLPSYLLFTKRKFQFDFVLFFFVLLILVYSILIIWSASNKNFLILEQRIIQIFIGTLLMLGLSQLHPNAYKKIARNTYFFGIFLLILVNLFGETINGAKRWLNLYIFQFQPSEIMKVIIPLFGAYYINQKNTYPISAVDCLKIFVFVCLPTLQILSEPDLGTAILVFLSGFFILFFSGIKWRFINVFILCLILLFPIFWIYCMHDYQRHRMLVMLNPEIDPLGLGYHIRQSKIAIGSGGLWGKGWLKGTQSKLEFLPECHTDFILSVVGEEFGLVGIIILFVLYFGIIFRIIFVAINAKNIFGYVFSGTSALNLFFSIFINVGMVSGIFPIVGIPLPLISHGGSSFLTLIIEFGIIMSIHSYDNNQFS